MSRSIRNFLESSGSCAVAVDPAPLDETTLQRLETAGISRRRFLSAMTGMVSMLGLPASMIPELAAAATSPKKPSVIFMSFQECTGCLESLVNSFSFQGGTSIENLILNVISMDYQENLMAAAGDQAEQWLAQLTATTGYILVVDGSMPAQAGSGYFVSGGRSGMARLRDAARNAKLVISTGTCASFGGLPKANPNPTGAIPISQALKTLGLSVPVINVPGCPPIPEVITGTILLYLAKGMPSLDSQLRPKTFYGSTVHDSCYREEFLEHGPHVKVFDDAAAKRGGCLIEMGCKGPVTHNACTRIKWNQGTSFPMMSGHGCIGCSEPDFWDRLNTGGRKGFYVPLAPGSYDD